MKKYLYIFYIFLSLTSFSQSLDSELIMAVYNNDEKTVYDLIRRGANVNTTTVTGISALMYAVQNGNYFICEKLISSGADVNYSTNDAVAPIINAVMNQDTAITLLLLENGANPDAIDKTEMQSALMFAIGRNNIFLSEALLYYNANPNKSVYDVTPLMHAIYLGVDTSFIFQLLKYGANPNLKNGKGYSPLMIATLYDNKNAANILLTKGVKPDTNKESSNNSMKIALKYQLDDFVKIYTPYYLHDAQKYHSDALLNNYYKGAKIIRKQSKKSFLNPILSSLILGTNFTFNHKDLLWGFKVGIAESRYNIDFKLGIEPRLFRKAILYELRPNFYLQLWEKRTLLLTEIDKKFVISANSKSVFGLYIRASYVFSFGDFKGYNIDIDNKKEFSAGGGLWFKKNFFKLNLNYSYLPIQNYFSHYFGVEMDFFVPFVF